MMRPEDDCTCTSIYTLQLCSSQEALMLPGASNGQHTAHARLTAQHSQCSHAAVLPARHAAPVVTGVAALHPAAQRTDAVRIAERLLLRQQRRHCRGRGVKVGCVQCSHHYGAQICCLQCAICMIAPEAGPTQHSPSLGLKLLVPDVGAGVSCAPAGACVGAADGACVGCCDGAWVGCTDGA